jgi:hypothetical protein
MTGRIRWEPAKYHGWTGHTGTLESWAFQVWQSNSDHGDVVLGEWELMTQLPVAVPRDGLRHSHDPEVLKAEAERWLERFVVSLGAVFPEGECPECGFRPPTHTHDKDCSRYRQAEASHGAFR